MEMASFYYQGRDWFADTRWGDTHYIRSFTEEYAVPKDPSKGGASFAIWGGLEDGTGDTILQGVLNWDGGSWSVHPEYQWGGPGGQDTQGTQSSTKPIGSQVSFAELLGGVLEVRSISGCLELPASDHIAFRDLKVVDSAGSSPSPVSGWNTPDPQCSMKVDYTATSADFIWTP